ncbi:MAG: MMPL family transporter, partial [Pirellulales bacterium]
MQPKSTWFQLLANYPWFVSRLVTNHWPWVIGGWIVIIILVRSIAPSWNDIAADGDLAFLPADVPSSIGRRAVEEAFPGSQSRSQMMIVLSRDSEKLTPGDLAVGLDVARRLHWMAARNAWSQVDLEAMQFEQAKTPGQRSESSAGGTKKQVLSSLISESLQDNLKQLIEIENDLAQFIEAKDPDHNLPRQIEAHDILSKLYEAIGDNANAEVERDTVKAIREQNVPTLDGDLKPWAKSILDIYTWRSRVVGHKLDAKGRARLIAVQLGTEFMATANIEIMEQIEKLLAEIRQMHSDRISSDLQIEVTGSAAIGADVLRASASGVKKTEIVTVVLVL